MNNQLYLFNPFQIKKNKGVQKILQRRLCPYPRSVHGIQKNVNIQVVLYYHIFVVISSSKKAGLL